MVQFDDKICIRFVPTKLYCTPKQWNRIATLSIDYVINLKIGENKFPSYLSRMQQTLHFYGILFFFFFFPIDFSNWLSFFRHLVLWRHLIFERKLSKWCLNWFQIIFMPNLSFWRSSEAIFICQYFKLAGFLIHV